MAGISVNIGADTRDLQLGIAAASSQVSSFVSGATNRLQLLTNASSTAGQGIAGGLSSGITQANTTVSTFTTNFSTRLQSLASNSSSVGQNIASSFSSAFSSIGSQFSSFFSNFNSRVQSLGDSFSSVGQKLSIGLSVPLGLLSKQLLENGGGLESLKMGLKSIEEQQYGVGNSAEYAAKRYDEYVQLAKLPGIGLKEAVAMSISLRSVGFSADDAKREILTFGNALALVGKGKNELNGVALQIQQLSGKTSGFGADIRVIKEYAPQVGAALMQAFGTIDTEAIAKTGVTGKQVIEKITTELEKLPKAGAGLKNAMENVSDSVFISTGRIGLGLSKVLGLNSLFDKIGSSLTGLADSFENLSPTTQKFIGIVGGLLVIVPPLLIGLGAVIMGISSIGGVMLVGATAIKGFVASSILGMTEFVTAVTISFAEATTAFGFFSNMLLLNPIGVVIAGVVLLGAAIYGLSKIIGSTTKEVSSLEHAENELNQVKKANYGTFETEIAKTTALVSVIKSNVRTIEEKQGALNQLIAISPKHFSTLTIEKVLAGEATAAMKAYTASIFENAVTKGAESKISKLAEQLTSEKDAYDEANNNLKGYIAERKKLGTTLTENDLRKSSNGGIFEKFQTSSTLIKGLDEAKSKVERTTQAMSKLSEFVAVRTLKVDGAIVDDKPHEKKLTKKEEEAIAVAQRKAQRAEVKGAKDSEDILIKLAEFKASIIEDELKKAVDAENAKYEKDKLGIERTKANAQVKFATLQALESSHNKVILDITSDAKKKESEFIINSLTHQTVKERALQQLSFEEKLKNIPKIIQGIANQNKAIELLEIEHQAKMKEIQSKGNITSLQSNLTKNGKIGDKNTDGSDGFGQFQGFKNGLNIGNPIDSLITKMNNSLPKLQATVGRNIEILQDLKNGINSSLQGGAANAAKGFANVLGQIGSGSAKFSDLGKVLVGAVSQMFSDFGNVLIEKGTAMLILDVLKDNPITSGPAMIAAGMLLSATASAGASIFSGNGSSSSGGGSSGYSQSYSSGVNGVNGLANNAYGMGSAQKLNVQIDFGGEFVMRRNEMVAGIRGTQKLQTRTYGG